MSSQVNIRWRWGGDVYLWRCMGISLRKVTREASLYSQVIFHVPTDASLTIITFCATFVCMHDHNRIYRSGDKEVPLILVHSTCIANCITKCDRFLFRRELTNGSKRRLVAVADPDNSMIYLGCLVANHSPV